MFGTHGTAAKATLLVNSKTPWMVTLHPTVKGQKACGYCVKQRSLMCLEIQWLDLPNRVTDCRTHTLPGRHTLAQDPSICASAASTWGSQNVIASELYRSLAADSSARACSRCPVSA
jgi:hypothetical protein